jgi:hypothetical protein
VPFGRSGDFKIVASFDIGKLGPSQSAPVVVSYVAIWHWSLLLGCLILAPLFLMRSNRCGRAWTALIPVLVALPPCWMVEQSGGDGLGSLLLAPMVALAALALAGEPLARLRPVGRVLLAAAAFIVAMLLSMALSVGTGSGNWMNQRLPLSIVAGVCLVGGLALARACLRRRLGFGRLAFWWGVWSGVLTAMALLLVEAGLLFLVGRAVALESVFFMMLGPMLIAGLFMNVYVQPFVILASASQAYRRRLTALLGLAPAAEAAPAEAPAAAKGGEAAQ